MRRGARMQFCMQLLRCSRNRIAPLLVRSHHDQRQTPPRIPAMLRRLNRPWLRRSLSTPSRLQTSDDGRATPRSMNSINVVGASEPLPSTSSWSTRRYERTCAWVKCCRRGNVRRVAVSLTPSNRTLQTAGMQDAVMQCNCCDRCSRRDSVASDRWCEHSSPNGETPRGCRPAVGAHCPTHPQRTRRLDYQDRGSAHGWSSSARRS